MRGTHWLLPALLVASSVAAGIAAQPGADSVATARQLYSAAAYDEALAVLERLDTPSGTTDRDVALTRALCLVALNREDAARQAMGTLVEIDPRFQFDPADASPRVRDLLHSVRAEKLPRVVRAKYAIGKRAFDAQDFALAAKNFNEVSALLDDSLLADDPNLADLRVLTRGFADLSTKLRAGTAVAVPANAQLPGNGSSGGRSATSQPTSPSSSRPATGTVVEPVVISQRPPEWPPQLGRARSGSNNRATVMVVIDETGTVTSARMVTGINPVYDVLLLDAARRWRYHPATLNGVPISFTRIVSVLIEGR